MTTIILRLFGGRIPCIQFALKLAIKHFKEQGEPDMAVIYEKMLHEVEEQDKKSTPSNDYALNEYKMRYRQICHRIKEAEKANDATAVDFWKGSLHECRHTLKHIFGLSGKEINKLEKKPLSKEEIKNFHL